MTGLTYSRTAGKEILTGTWDYVRNRYGKYSKELLDPAYRYTYDTASAEEREQFDQLAAQPLTKPPRFLVFDLAASGEHIKVYQGEADQNVGHPADGRVEQMSLVSAAALLSISVNALEGELKKFSGVVTVISLPAGSVLYRTIGLTSKNARYGSVTNALFSNYWEAKCPSSYPSIEAWRAATAVMREWNGDFGYLKVVLARPVVMLSGIAAMQKIAREGNKVLPGGAHQYFIPHLSDQDLTEPLIGRPLEEIIFQTRFGGIED